MSFLDVLSRVSDKDIAETLETVTGDEVLSTLSKSVLAIEDALILLSPQALLYLEDMAQLAHERTVQQFGYTIQLFTPMYISQTIATMVVCIVDIAIIVGLLVKN